MGIEKTVWTQPTREVRGVLYRCCKICSLWGTNDEFWGKKEKSWYCIPCDKAKGKAWLEKKKLEDPEWYEKRRIKKKNHASQERKRRRERSKAWINGRPCTYCGGEADFGDHVNPNAKSRNGSQISNDEEYKKEMEKCVPCCRKCNSTLRITRRRRGFIRRRKKKEE